MKPQGADFTAKGYCHPDWEGVRTAFSENFRDHGDVGASLCINIGGETKVDLAGGWFDADRQIAWESDTLSVVYSATKAAVAVCAHLLVDRGALSLHDPVSHYWPEFAQNGKEQVTVAMLLDHSAGVPGFREPLKPDAYLDWDYMVERIEREAPFWEPGTRSGYHVATFGWTVGEIVRRVGGQRLGAFFASEIAGPLGLEFWIGLPEDLDHKVSPMLAPRIDAAEMMRSPIASHISANPQSAIAQAHMNSGGAQFFGSGPHDRSTFDTRAYRAAEIGAASGVSNGRGLAGLYRALAHDGGGLLSRRQIEQLGRTSMASHKDAMLLMPTHFSPGFMKRVDCRYLPGGDAASFLIGDRAFGHSGAGGSIGFADPECAMSFGYSVNQMGGPGSLDPRAQRLIDAAYRCVEIA